jgi:hypothetical protein
MQAYLFCPWKGWCAHMTLQTRWSVVVGLVVCAAGGGCQAMSSWSHGVQRQFERAADEIKEDLSVMDDDYDGLDAFGPDAAKEMRAARADMMR